LQTRQLFTKKKSPLCHNLYENFYLIKNLYHNKAKEDILKIFSKMVHFCLGWLQNLILNNKPDKEEDCDDSNPEDTERQLEVSRFYETAGG